MEEEKEMKTEKIRKNNIFLNLPPLVEVKGLFLL